MPPISSSGGRVCGVFWSKVFLDGKPADAEVLRERTTTGVDEIFNRGNRLPGGAQFHVTVEFTDNRAEAHGVVKIIKPGSRSNQTNWAADESSQALAHEVGHFLGLQDEYHESLAAARAQRLALGCDATLSRRACAAARAARAWRAGSMLTPTSCRACSTRLGEHTGENSPATLR